jgi:hypothetical protein
VKFHIGDKVKLGSTRIGTITDVGTVLIQVKTSEGSLRVVCRERVFRGEIRSWAFLCHQRVLLRQAH